MRSAMATGSLFKSIFPLDFACAHDLIGRFIILFWARHISRVMKNTAPPVVNYYPTFIVFQHRSHYSATIPSAAGAAAVAVNTWGKQLLFRCDVFGCCFRTFEHVTDESVKTRPCGLTAPIMPSFTAFWFPLQRLGRLARSIIGTTASRPFQSASITVFEYTRRTQSERSRFPLHTSYPARPGGHWKRPFDRDFVLKMTRMIILYWGF